MYDVFVAQIYYEEAENLFSIGITLELLKLNK